LGEGSTGGETSNTFILEDCVHTNTSPLQNTLSQASTPVPAGFISPTHLGHIFARKKNEEGQNSPRCHHQFHLNCRWGVVRLGSLIWGHISRDVWSPPGGLSCMLGFSPHKGSRWGRLCMKKGEKGCLLARGESAWAPPPKHARSLLMERATQFTILKSDMRWPAGIF